MLVLGLLVGAGLSAYLSGDHTREVVPELWNFRFGPSVPLRLTGGFLGGALMMIGARLAKGCTSGHGIQRSLAAGPIKVDFCDCNLFRFRDYGIFIGWKKGAGSCLTLLIVYCWDW